MAYDPLLHDKLVFLSEMFSMAYDLKLAEVKFSFVGFSHRYKTASIILNYVDDCSLLLGWVTKFLQLI